MAVLFPRYYPYHYAPFVSDLVNLADFKPNLPIGRPFLPFEQLLSVLPAASQQHLPKAYSVGPNSPGLGLPEVVGLYMLTAVDVVGTRDSNCLSSG